MNEDAQLLRRYAEENSEPAFAELVRRHLGFVYAAALRRVGGDAHLAQDVTQQVFTALARGAKGLARHPVLSGWLYTTTRNVAAQTVRTERRRRAREQEAHTMNESRPSGAPQPEWERLRPELDEAMDQLGERDREAVLLRFFEGCSLAEVGPRLQLTENAARMRVQRALDKMHETLARRGVSSTAAALGSVLAAQAGLAAPPGLATTVTGVALAGAATSGTVAAFTFMSMSKLQWVVTGILVTAGIGGLTFQQQANRELKAQIATLSQRNDEIARLREENRRLTESATRSASRSAVAAAAPPESPAALKPASNRPAVPKVALAPGLTPIDTLGHPGRLTARSALSTQLWAAAQGDVNLEATVITFDPDARAKLEALLATLPEASRVAFGTPEHLMAFVLAGSPHPVGGMQVLGESEQGPDDVIVQMNWQHADDTVVHHSDIDLRRDDAGWKMVVPMILVDRAVAYVTRTAGAGPTPGKP